MRSWEVLLVFSRNVQLATTWRIIADIMLFHCSELEMAIEQDDADTEQYSLALTERTLGVPYIYFNVSSQNVQIHPDFLDHELIAEENVRPATELQWDTNDYVAAFLSRDPYSVILDIEALAGFTRKEYRGCWVTRTTLPITLIAGMLQRKMFTDTRLEVCNSFCHSAIEENCKVREWARSERSMPGWVFDDYYEDWVEKAKAGSHLWKLGPAVNFNHRDTSAAPGIVFDLEQCTASLQGSSDETLSLWDMKENGIGYNASLDILEKALDWLL